MAIPLATYLRPASACRDPARTVGRLSARRLCLSLGRRASTNAGLRGWAQRAVGNGHNSFGSMLASLHLRLCRRTQ